MSALDPKALEAAREAWLGSGKSPDLVIAIRTYLSSLSPVVAAPVVADELVARLRLGRNGRAYVSDDMRAAADRIYTLTAERDAAVKELSAFKACHNIGRVEDGYREAIWREASDFYEANGCPNAALSKPEPVKG